MSTLVEEIVEALNPQVTPAMSQELKVEESKAAQVLPLVAPLVISGMKRMLSGEGGLDQLTSLLDNDAVDDDMDDVSGAVHRYAAKPEADSDVNLGGILGAAGGSVVETLGKHLGLNAQQSTQALVTIAPLVLSFLSKKRSQTGGVSGLASLLDQDGDGNLLDDVGGMLLNHIASKHTGSGPTASSPIGQILGSLLK